MMEYGVLEKIASLPREISIQAVATAQSAIYNHHPDLVDPLTENAPDLFYNPYANVAAGLVILGVALGQESKLEIVEYAAIGSLLVLNGIRLFLNPINDQLIY